MNCKPGELVLIPFPYADLAATKKRPVLVLSEPDRHGDFIALAVTSVEQRAKAAPITADNLSTGSLPKPSWIRLDKVFTLSASSIVKAIGTVEPAILKQALAGLCATVGYPSN